jgi:hypothetical protein
MTIELIGPSIGRYMDQDIPGFIVVDGGRMAFDRIAHDDGDGDVDLSQLRRGEVITSPGLIYAPLSR